VSLYFHNCSNCLVLYAICTLRYPSVLLSWDRTPETTTTRSPFLGKGKQGIYYCQTSWDDETFHVRGVIHSTFKVTKKNIHTTVDRTTTIGFWVKSHWPLPEVVVDTFSFFFSLVLNLSVVQTNRLYRLKKLFPTHSTVEVSSVFRVGHKDCLLSFRSSGYINFYSI